MTTVNSAVAVAFNAPTANDAYAQAPDINAEAAAVAELLVQLDPEHRLAFYPPPSAAERHEVLLRAAAVADRRWWADQSPETLAAADQAAAALMELDKAHPIEAEGPIPPYSIEWAAPGGPRAYIRQEYRSWLLGPIDEDCNNCQGETCRQCNRAQDAPPARPELLPVLLAWPSGSSNVRLTLGQIDALRTFVEDLVAEND